MAECFLRLFPAYRKLEIQNKSLITENSVLSESYDRLEKDYQALQKKNNSDTNLINSLNRYIETLEGKAKMRAEQIQELRDELQILLGVTRNQKHKEDLP